MLLLIAILLLNSFIVDSKVIELNNTNFITIRGQINEDTTNQFFTRKIVDHYSRLMTDTGNTQKKY